MKLDNDLHEDNHVDNEIHERAIRELLRQVSERNRISSLLKDENEKLAQQISENNNILKSFEIKVAELDIVIKQAQKADLDRDNQITALNGQLLEASNREQAMEQTVAERESKITSLTIQVQEALSRAQVMEQTVAERESKITSLTIQVQEALSRAQVMEQAVVERESKIAELTGQLQEALSRAQAAEQAVTERNDQIVGISAKLEQSNSRSASLANEIAEMRRSIVWQTTMRFHNGFVERAMPHGTVRRRKYDTWLEKSRTLVGGAYGINQTSNTPFVESNILSYHNQIVPVSLNDCPLIKFAFPVADLNEIKVLTATYNRINSDVTLTIADSLTGSPIRIIRVKGNNILNNDYTSFRFKPINDSADKTFFVKLRSDSEPSAAVWYSSEMENPSTQLYKFENKIPGGIGFQALASFDVKSPYDLWVLKNEPRGSKLDDCRETCSLLKYKPKISIVTPVWNTDQRWLRLAIESVLDQIYDNWELCIIDGGSTKRHIKKVINKYANRDSRIKIKILKENKGIAGNSNEALSLVTGEFVGFLDHDDELLPFSLFEVAKALNKNPKLDFIYSDEDKIDEHDQRKDPFFKPDWSPDMFLSCNYLCHFSVIRKKVLDEIGGFSLGYDGSQDYDLFLKATEVIDEENIFHIPRILYHWRMIPESAAASCSSKPYAFIAAKKALTNSMTRRGIQIDGVHDGLWPGIYRIRYAIKGDPSVSIIIPNRDNSDVLKRCIDSILKNTLYPNYEIVVIDNQSREDETLQYYNDLSKINKVKISYYAMPFNYSAINNFAVSETNSDYIMFLNNDTEIISGEWLSSMLEHAQRKEVGAVGGKLLFRNGSIQHCGVVLGLGGVAGHPYSKYPDHNGYFCMINIIKNYSAVTAACMLTRRSCFEEVGGFDEVNLPIAFNDVDYCLKLRRNGYFIVYTPYAQLYHHESLTRGSDDTPEKQERFLREINYMKSKWIGSLDSDPFYNPNLSLTKWDVSINLNHLL